MNDEKLISDRDKEDFAFELQKYFDRNFDEPLSNLQATLFVEFIEEHLGKYFYNKGIEDSISIIKDKAEDLYLYIKD